MAGVGQRTVHVVVRGAVQGVGFRWFVRQCARSLLVRGWVMNRSDGAVEMQAQGAAAAIDNLLAAVRGGPSGARVDACEVTPVGPTDSADDLPDPFDIRRGVA
jgi:acylphosphatase